MRGRLWVWARGVCALVGLVVILVTVTPVVVWMGGVLGGRWEDSRGETLIVLTGSGLENRVIGDSSYWRSVYAVLFWREAGYRTIWITGYGDGQDGTPALMREFLIGQGVPREIIHLDSESRNTQASARTMARLLAGDGSRKVLLTSDYHMWRSRRLFAREGLAVQTIPIPDAQKRGARMWTRWQAFLDVCEELVKIGWYGVRGML